jgi:hypothetical protein
LSLEEGSHLFYESKMSKKTHAMSSPTIENQITYITVTNKQRSISVKPTTTVAEIKQSIRECDGVMLGTCLLHPAPESLVMRAVCMSSLIAIVWIVRSDTSGGKHSFQRR